MSRTDTPSADDEGVDNDGEIERATVTKANPRLTSHTVQSMLWGAIRGWTTLTANRTSVKAILKEMKAVKRGVSWDHAIDEGGKDMTDEEQSAVAALWVVDPRSLAEGMRADFGAQS